MSARPKDKLSSVETEDGALKGRRYREPKAREGDLTGRLQDLYDLCAEVALIRSACSGKWLLSGEPECFGCAQNSARVPSNPRD